MHQGRDHGTVLLVEDSAPTRDLLATVLRRAGYEVVAAGGGEEAMALFSSAKPDLLLLDVTMTGMSGWEVLDLVRERSDVPILMLSGVSDDASKVRALNGGADDYVVKPASAPELVARIGALLRRSRRVQDAAVTAVYEDGVVRVDFDRRSVHVHGRALSLTPLEYRLLAAFVRRPGHVLSREDLLREVWRDTTGGPSEHVKIYVGYLRRKLAELTDVELIETVRGFGYRWLREQSAPRPAADGRRLRAVS